MIVDGAIFSIGCFYSATSVAINDTFFFFPLSSRELVSVDARTKDIFHGGKMFSQRKEV